MSAGEELREEPVLAAKQTLVVLENKTERMNIRMTKRDLLALKAAAESEGIPYHSLVTSILHKLTTGQLVDMNEAKKTQSLLIQSTNMTKAAPASPP